MRKHVQILSIAAAFSVVALAVGLYISRHDIAILNPSGSIALQQRNLILTALGLMLIVVIPVFVLLFFIGIKYHAGNKKAAYRPDWDSDRKLEFIWWLVPLSIIAVLAVITWKSSHSLDPFKPIVSTKKPLTVQVVALQWKWLFIYPEQNIASVNYVQIPVDTPIQFEITADAPMNSFWIPKLGGQIYAMEGMKTELNLEANEQGQYQGVSANISGEGFAGMKFTTNVTSRQSFDAWVKTVQKNSKSLSDSAYKTLREPSENNKPSFYSSVTNNMFDTIINSFMVPAGSSNDTMHGMHNTYIKMNAEEQ